MKSTRGYTSKRNGNGNTQAIVLPIQHSKLDLILNDMMENSFGQFMTIGKMLKIVTVATMLMMMMAMMTVKRVKMMMMWMMLIMVMMTLHHTDPCCSSCSSSPTSKPRTGCCYNTWCSERVVRASSNQMYWHQTVKLEALIPDSHIPS